MKRSSIKTARFVGGLLEIDGERQTILGVEYPYYRDRPHRWEAKLRKLASAGANVVTCYVPWRHHEVASAAGGHSFVFDGENPADNRNLRQFLRLAAGQGFAVILKPGPYVSGETAYGGLPDRLLPGPASGIAPLTFENGAIPRCQSLPLPSPFDAIMIREAARWLDAVRKFVAEESSAMGPVVALQACNEGIYNDYNSSQLPTGRAVRPQSLAGEGARDEENHQAQYFKAGWGEVRNALGSALPLFANVPPPRFSERGATEAWLARSDIRNWGGVEYGFTSWMGNALEDDEALASLVLAAGWWPGPQLEENWGFTWFDRRYGCGITEACHAVAALAAGATGLVAYPGCATDSPSTQVDLPPERRSMLGREAIQYEQPYGAEAPVGLNGEPGPLWGTLALLGQWLAVAGSSLCAAVPQPVAVMVVDPGHLALAIQGKPGSETPAGTCVANFMLSLIRRGRLGAVLSLDSPYMIAPTTAPALVREVDLETNKSLRQAMDIWSRAGGEVITVKTGREDEVSALVDTILPPSGKASSTVSGRRYDSRSGITSCFVINRSTARCEHQEIVDSRQLKAQMVGLGSLMIQVRDGHILNILHKGENEIGRDAVPLHVSYDNATAERQDPGDAVWIRPV